MDSYYPISVKPLPDYRLMLTFDNNEQRIFDVTPYLDDPFFAPLRNIAFFETASINPISVEWNGGIDFCPDELYYNSEPMSSTKNMGDTSSILDILSPIVCDLF